MNRTTPAGLLPEHKVSSVSPVRKHGVLQPTPDGGGFPFGSPPHGGGFQSRGGRVLVTAVLLLAVTAVALAIWALAGPDAQAAPADLKASVLTVIPAKDASAKGKWTAVENALASGGTYMSPGADGVGTSLEFPIEVAAATEIAVTPVWFVHGDQHKARRFPDTFPWFNVQQTWPLKGLWYDYNARATLAAPVLSKPGPDALAVLGDKAYFTAPAGGKVGVADLQTEKVTGGMDVGGYAADLVIDKDRNELLVADAGRNLIVVFGLKDGKKTAEIPVPALPWSIALHQGKLYVAAMAAKKIAVVDVAARKVEKTIDLPVGPQNVSVTAGENPQLIVRLLPMVHDIKTLKEVPADRQTYWPWNDYNLEAAEGEKEAMDKAAVAYPKGAFKLFFCGRRPRANILDAGPSRSRTRASYQNPPPPSKLFLVEPGAKAITVVPADGGKTTKIDLDETPAAMDLFDAQLYVLCKQAKKVLVIDVKQEKVVNTVDLPYVADEFYVGTLVPRYTTVEQLSSAPVMHGAMPGRIAVGFHPLAFDPRTLAAAPPPDLPFLPLDRHNKAAPRGGKVKQLFVDNLHTIQVDEKRWIDTTPVTDYQRSGNPALLMPGDQPGAITLRVDDGPECDWENDVWFTPGQRTMLVRGTDEFDLHNAVRFTLAPGKHVLKVKAYNRYANLDGIRIKRTLAGSLEAQLKPLPEDVHGKVALEAYGGTFGANEPVSFNLSIRNKSDRPLALAGAWTVRNYQGKTVLEGKDTFAAKAGETLAKPLNLDLKESGRCTFHIKLSSADGEYEFLRRFVRMPPLGHPRLIYREDETKQIQDRVAKYPLLYQRYRDYLRRQSAKADFMPQLMRGSWGQEMVKENVRWRALCLQFADMFLENGAKRYESKLLGLLSGPGGYDVWQGDYEFGVSHTILADLMYGGSENARKSVEKAYGVLTNADAGRIEVNGIIFPDYAMTIKEPFTTTDRLVLDRVSMELNNYDGYFAAHAGSRGGNWFHGTGAMCVCPIHSMTRTFLWVRNLLGEKEFFERTNIGGVLTLQSYAFPRYDTKTFYSRSAFRGTWDTTKHTQAMRWALSGLSRQPLEKTYYKEVFDCIEKLNAPMKDEVKEVDELLAPGTSVAIPFYLAIGWIDPALKGVAWEEMPPSMIFDGEGAVCMKSGWDKNMTDIYFVSGVKDTSYRALPNHFQVFKAGEMIAGMARVGDHGSPVPLSGNSVRVGEDERFPGYLNMGWGGDRQDERLVTDCFSPSGYTRMFRDWRLSGYRQEGACWDGGGHGHAYPREVALHSHTSHPYFQEGRILAYETSPAFDYVVGDATNSWPVEQVEEAYRQMVFVRPDVIVIYDRLALGEQPKNLNWPMMTLRNKASPKSNPTLTGDVFTSTNGVASLWGKALLPKGGKINATVSGVEFWEADNVVGYIDIQPPQKSRRVEFLVALRTGLAQPSPLECKLVEDDAQSGVTFAYEGKNYTVRFNRQGAPGGNILIEEGGKKIVDRPLAQTIRDSYENWKGAEHFDKWMNEDRFKTYVTETDRKKFGSPKGK